ncbi:hypothetical protein Tco_0088624 [Tanacetum coccineum]
MVPSSSNSLQIVHYLFIVDSGCTKHMTGNLKLLCNFVEKFLGTVCFENEQLNDFPAVKGCCNGDLDNYHLKELRCSTQCHAQDVDVDNFKRCCTSYTFDGWYKLIQNFAKKESIRKLSRSSARLRKLISSCILQRFRTSKDNEEPQLNTSFQDQEKPHKTTSLESALKIFISVVFVPIGTFPGLAPFLKVQMMSDHNSSDLAPQRQEMSVENVASGNKEAFHTTLGRNWVNT